MLCLIARPQIHLLNVKTCLDVVNTPICYGCTNPSMSCAGIASGSVQLGLVLRSFKDSWVCSVRSWTFWSCPHLIRQGQTRVLRLWTASAPVPAGITRGSGRAVRSCHWEFPPYPGDRVAPKLVADAPDGGCQYCILASLRGARGGVEPPLACAGAAKRPGAVPSRPWRYMA